MNASIDPYLRACILISFFSVKWTTLITGQSVIHFAKLKLKELTNRINGQEKCPTNPFLGHFGVKMN